MLNRNWPAGLRYVVSGLARLGRIEDARAALAELKVLNPNLAFVEGNLRRLYVPELCDLIIDCADGYIVPIRGEGGGEFVDPTGKPEIGCAIDLVDFLHAIPRK